MKIEQDLNFFELSTKLGTNLYLNLIAQYQRVLNEIFLSDVQDVQNMDEFRNDEKGPVVMEHYLYLNSILKKNDIALVIGEKKIKMYFMRYKLTHT